MDADGFQLLMQEWFPGVTLNNVRFKPIITMAASQNKPVYTVGGSW